jgi:hypothetical protein
MADPRSLDELVTACIELGGRGPAEERGRLANALLSKAHRSTDLGPLRRLLDANDAEGAKTLVFVLSELGGRSIEAMGWLDELLDRPDAYVQHYAVVAVQHSGSLSHGSITAKAVSKLAGDRAVRFGALKFVAFGSLRQIETGIDHLDVPLDGAVRWLVDGRYDDITARLDDPHLVTALVAVAVATRVRDDDPSPLERAASHPRAELSDAARYLARFRPLPTKGKDVLHRLARQAAEGEGGTGVGG